MKCICIKDYLTKGGSLLFYSGRKYEYIIQNVFYLVNDNTRVYNFGLPDLKTSKVVFDLYFKDERELREERLNQLLND